MKIEIVGLLGIYISGSIEMGPPSASFAHPDVTGDVQMPPAINVGSYWIFRKLNAVP
jgi:hypothetical protein